MLRKHNVFDVTGDYGIGYTTNTGRAFYFDLDDYDLISQYVWHEDRTKTGYASVRTAVKGKHMRLTQVLGYTFCDHLNRNPFDNRRQNLREATRQQNVRNHNKPKNNTSGCCGVAWMKNVSKWEAYIWINNQKKRLGLFENKEDAVRERVKAEQEVYGVTIEQEVSIDEFTVL